MNESITKKEIVSIGLTILFFILSAYIAQMYSEQIKQTLETQGYWSIPLYIFIAFVATVVAPVSAMPLMPVASMLWGPFLAAIYSIIGWSLGSFVAFCIARRYGYYFLQKFRNTQKIQRFLQRLSPKRLFVSVMILRTASPVDALSYILGLFTKMPFSHYALATVIGVSPFAFIFSYISMMPLALQLSALSIVGIVLFVEYNHVKRIIEKEAD